MLTIVGGYIKHQLAFVLTRTLSEGLLYVPWKRRRSHGRRQFPLREDVGREVIQFARLSMKGTLGWWTINRWSTFLWTRHFHEHEEDHSRRRCCCQTGVVKRVKRRLLSFLCWRRLRLKNPVCNVKSRNPFRVALAFSLFIIWSQDDDDCCWGSTRNFLGYVCLLELLLRKEMIDDVRKRISCDEQ